MSQGSRMSFIGRDMAVDLGTANTLVYVRGRGIVVDERELQCADGFLVDSRRVAHLDEFAYRLRVGRGTMHVTFHVLRWHGRGVIAFDLAGPEAGWPATRHADLLARLREAGLPLTLKAP